MRSNRWLALGSVVVAAAGCGGDARVDFAAADTLEAMAKQLQQGFAEYHADLAASDETREAEAIAAFVARLKKDAADDAQVEQHTEAFSAALAKLRQDRRAAEQRLRNGQDNVAGLNEVARGLRKLAIESLTVQDEIRRYFRQLLEARKAAQAAGSSKPSTEGARTSP